MSLLGNHNNNFEKRLKKQLGDTEFKPSESLWDNIDHEINKPDFEKQIGSKLNNYEVKPSKQTWAQIERQLPPEPNKWAFAYKLRLGVVLLLFSSGLIFGYWLKTQQQTTVLANKSTIKSDTPPTTKDAKVTRSTNTSNTTTVTKINNNVVTSSSPSKSYAGNKQVNDYLLTNKSRKKYHSTLHAFATSTQNNNKLIAVKQAVANKNVNKQMRTNNVTNGGLITVASAPVVVKPNADQPAPVSSVTQSAPTNAPVDALAILPIDEKISQPTINNNLTANDTSVHTPAKQILADTALAMHNNILHPEKANNYTFALRILAGAHQSNMLLTSASNRDMSANIAMRKKVEKPQISISSGFLVELPINQKWHVASGVFISHFKMDMTYDIAPASMPINAEKGATYTNISDSVKEGKFQNQTISYSWNEIPLLFTYKFKTFRKLSFETTVGLSYAIVNTVDAAMVGNNNIGVLVVKGKEAFPIIKNSVFVHANIGANYQLNESVFITASPYFRHSVTSMVATKNWVQQYPYFIGLNVGLRKLF